MILLLGQSTQPARESLAVKASHPCSALVPIRTTQARIHRGQRNLEIAGLSSATRTESCPTVHGLELRPGMKMWGSPMSLIPEALRARNLLPVKGACRGGAAPPWA